MQIIMTCAKNKGSAQLIGELDHHSAGAAKKKMDQAIDTHKLKELRLDCKQMSFMDSSGIGVLIALYKKLQHAGGDLIIARPNAAVDRVLRLSGIYQVCKRVG